MTVETFQRKYNKTYFKVKDFNNLEFIINTYANNKLHWKSNLEGLLKFKKKVLEYNKIGIIISIRDGNIFYGYYDDKIRNYIVYEEEFNINYKKQEEMTDIKSILEGIYKHKDLRNSIVPLFLGNPGLAKTTIIKEFAKEKNVNLVEIITSQISPFEISGIAIPSHNKEEMVYYDFDKLNKLKDGDILYFDELLNGSPVVLSACLTLIESRTMISGKPLPDIMIVAAANRQGMTVLTPQIKERFVWYDVSFNQKNWTDFMIKKYNVTKNICDKLASLVKEEKFDNEFNFKSSRSLDKAVNMVIKGVYTPYQNIVKPILEEMIVNTTGESIKLNDEEFLPNQSLPWLTIKRKMDGITTE